MEGEKFLVTKALAMLVALTLATDAASASECPLDQIVFRDGKAKREFAAERVALDISYACGSRIVRSTRERPDLKECRGPYGDTIIEGFLEGQKVYAIYTVIAGSPCCSWESYTGSNTAVPKKVREWLPSGEGPKVQIGSAWYTIADNPVPDTGRVRGPLGGGNFVPSECRKP
ncbi:hypothetical protein SAMN05444161_5859 [Rhizobiales bacterium GAS191]|nr:hypothetical protein SAMN05444161_5859 [Rhizobiales bacterium GAS191]